MLNPDESEDDNFRCNQANGVAAQAREELSRGMALLTRDDDYNDPFVDCDDNKELETNETVLENATD